MKSDLQGLGQLILLLMKHTCFDDVKEEVSKQFSHLVQSLSFTFTSWNDVLSHPLLNVDDSVSLIKEKPKED